VEQGTTLREHDEAAAEAKVRGHERSILVVLSRGVFGDGERQV
jgi:hypothetical protein